MSEIEDLRAQLAAANEARERAEKRGEKAALALTRAHEVIALQRNEINPEKYPEIDEAAGDVLDPCDEMADKLDKALADLDLAQKALRATDMRLAAAESRAAEAEADVARLERLHAACDATIRELTNKALAAVRGQEAAEARAERLVEALAPFADPERYNTTEEECRENKAMRWCAVHSFRWPCPVGPARAALAAKEGLGETAPTDAALRAEVERLEEKVRRIESACGLPDPAEACRVILAIAAEEGK